MYVHGKRSKYTVQCRNFLQTAHLIKRERKVTTVIYKVFFKKVCIKRDGS